MGRKKCSGQTNTNTGIQTLQDVSLYCTGYSNLNDEAAVSGRIGSNDTNHLPTITYLDKEIEKMKPSTILMSSVKVRSEAIQFSDNLFYIYTSGTTGLPKAAIIKHSKFILASIMCRHIIGLRENDVLYSAGLPLYHTLG